MIDTFGQLHLPQTAPQEVAEAFVWSECPLNTILVLMSVVFVLTVLRDFIRLLPTLSACMFRTRPNIELEHNFHTSRERDICSLAFLIPFILIVDRFRLYHPSIFDRIQPEWSSVAVMGAVIVFIVLRYIFYPIRPDQLHGDESKAAHCFLFTCFTLLVPLMLLSIGAMLVFNAPEDAVRSVLLVEIAIFYFISIIKTGQFLAGQCSGLSTILYLCALEIIPATFAVVSDLIL